MACSTTDQNGDLVTVNEYPIPSGYQTVPWKDEEAIYACPNEYIALRPGAYARFRLRYHHGPGYRKADLASLNPEAVRSEPHFVGA